MIGDIMQPTHLLFVLVIALLVLGPKRLPEVGRQLGKGLRDFRAAINGEQANHHDELGADQGHVSPMHQTQPQPVEHQFAHETAESFGGQAADTSTEEQQADAGSPDHQADAGSPDHQADAGSPDHQADGGTSGTAGEHEFAYQPAHPAEKPVDPLS